MDSRDYPEAYTEPKGWWHKEVEDLKRQLAAALAAIKSKDAALQSAISAHKYESGDLHDALAIQPDDRALKAWLGEPVGWAHSCNVLCLDNVELWIDRCPHCGKPAPKGMTK